MIKTENDIEVLVYRRPDMFSVNDNLYNMVGLGELKKLFRIENYVCEKQALELFYPERFLNIVEQRALLTRIVNAKNYTECRITTQSPFIIQCSTNVRIAQVPGEQLTENQFRLSWGDGMPDDAGLGVM
jgi:hypothetical protein